MTPDMRSRVKQFSYGIAYGMSAYGVSQRLGVEMEEAASFIESNYAQFRSDDTRHAEPGQAILLRHRVRDVGVRGLSAARRRDGRGGELHREQLRSVPIG